MGFANDTGYVPLSVAEILDILRQGVNAQFGTSYTAETFVGTNYYKFMYSLAQRIQANEVKASEIFAQLQQYFKTTNEKVLRPNTTHPGIYDYFKSKGFLSSTKAPIDADAGKLFVCVDVDETADDYADTKLEICNIVKDCCVAGVISQGTEVETITLPNNQSFDFKFNLPTRIPVLLRLTVTQSENNLFTIDDPLVVREALYNKILANYRLGKNFEPQRYFSVVDAPWAAEVLLEWSDDAGGNWHPEVFESEYDEIFTFELDDITVIEA